MFKEPVNIPLESLHKLLCYDFGKFYNQGKKGLRGLSDTHMPGGTVVKNLPAKQETWVRSLGGEDPLEKAMATHSSILAWRIRWTRGGWQATVHGVAKSQTRLSNWAPRGLKGKKAEKQRIFRPVKILRVTL